METGEITQGKRKISRDGERTKELLLHFITFFHFKCIAYFPWCCCCEG